MCEMEIVKDETGELPILLLDDFMSELDNYRIKMFFENIEKTQVIITCTEKIEAQEETTFFKVENGKII